MNSPTLGLRVASILFGVMCLAQLLRVAVRPEILVAGHLMPLWPSILAAIVLGALCLWLWNIESGRDATNSRHS